MDRHTRATETLAQLENLLSWPAKQRMPNLLLLGETNSGKSMIIEEFRRSHPLVSHPDREEIPVLVVQMPSDPQVGGFNRLLQRGPGRILVVSGCRLSAAERAQIEVLFGQGLRFPQIAVVIGRDRSTVWREVTRNNSYRGGHAPAGEGGPPSWRVPVRGAGPGGRVPVGVLAPDRSAQSR